MDATQIAIHRCYAALDRRPELNEQATTLLVNFHAQVLDLLGAEMVPGACYAALQMERTRLLAHLCDLIEPMALSVTTTQES
jgi:hypothetical protein